MLNNYYMSENTTTLPDILCPWQLFGIYLQLEIQTKLDLGHNLIVQGDFNSHYGKLNTCMLELGIEDIIAKKYGKGPNTYNRSSDTTYLVPPTSQLSTEVFYLR